MDGSFAVGDEDCQGLRERKAEGHAIATEQSEGGRQNENGAKKRKTYGRTPNGTGWKNIIASCSAWLTRVSLYCSANS